MKFHSPWLDIERPLQSMLDTDLSCDVAIVGAGISGIATLYYLLKETNKKVAVFEKHRVASGATGHNAGLAVAHIEEPLSQLVERIGKKAAGEAFIELDVALDDIHAIHDEIGLKNNLLSFPYTAIGFISLSEYLSTLEECIVQQEFGRGYWRHQVADHLNESVPQKFLPYIEFVPHETILKTLKTIDPSYIAINSRTSAVKGNRMNSALFCYKVLEYLQVKYSDRFALYEHTDITSIDLYKDHSVLKSSGGMITTKKVILCTNAYKHFSIHDKVHNKPVTKLHESIKPRIGYLAAFPDASKEGYAFGFMNQSGSFKEVPYWYFSHAPHSQHNANHSCVIGGPEFFLDESYSEQWVKDMSQHSLDLIKHFLNITFKNAPTSFPFYWHGLMGYTPDGLRWVGPDQDHPHLWYNLACNGIGIVPAIAGAKKIAALLASARY